MRCKLLGIFSLKIILNENFMMNATFVLCPTVSIYLAAMSTRLPAKGRRRIEELLSGPCCCSRHAQSSESSSSRQEELSCSLGTSLLPFSPPAPLTPRRLLLRVCSFASLAVSLQLVLPCLLSGVVRTSSPASLVFASKRLTHVTRDRADEQDQGQARLSASLD